MTKTILCYGDSNVWGFVPCEENYKASCTKRYPKGIRWSGRLQSLLGERYHVIEEGLNSRTTNIDYQVPPDRNGATYLPPCLYSHSPIDLVVFALGGNDLKSYFGRSPSDVCRGISALVDIVQSSRYGFDMQHPPEILILSQSIPLPIAEQYVDENGVYLFKDLIANARALVSLYEKLAYEKKCHFLNLTDFVKPSEFDGVHLDESAHKICAEMVSKKICDIFA